MVCLNKGSHEVEGCRQASKEYLNCRMEKGLMVKEDWKNLGFKEESQQ